MIILGLHFGHDAAVALVRDGRVESCVIRERQTRIKHAMTLDVETIFKAIKDANIKCNEIDYCAITSTQGVEIIVDNPERVSISIDYHNHISNVSSTMSEIVHESLPNLLPCLFDEMPEYRGLRFTREYCSNCYPEYKNFNRQDIKYVRWIDNYVSDDTWYPAKTLKELSDTNLSSKFKSDFLKYGFHFPARILLDGHALPAFFINHHACHAASSYYRSGFHEAAILTHDGGNGLGYDSGMFYYAESHSIYPIAPHHSIIGWLYNYVAYFLNLGSFSAGKLMGLAAYGRPNFFDKKYLGNWNDLVRLTHIYDMGGVCDHWIYHCLSLAKKMDYDIEPLGDVNRMTAPINADIAASTQKLFEENMLILVEILYNYLIKNGVNVNKLCISGGAALNCPTNSRIAREGRFGDVFIEPGCDDSGLAIGAALYCYHNILNNLLLEEQKKYLSSPFLGPHIAENDILSAVEYYSNQIYCEKTKNLAEDAALELSNNHIIGWFDERSEVGPRALGHRSILADPRDFNNWEKVNNIKKRERWRPFAPAVLESEAEKWFSEAPIPSPYMLFNAFVKSKDIPAITHVDGSARIQTVNKMNGIFFDLINEFFKITGIPIVLNTSFNGQSEPIIETPMDALKFFVDSELDALYIGYYKIKHRLVKEKGENLKIGRKSRIKDCTVKDIKNPVILCGTDKVKELVDSPPYPQPLLIEENYKGYNLIWYGRLVYAVPQYIQQFDVTNEQEMQNQVILSGETTDKVKGLVDDNPYPQPLLIEGYKGYNLIGYHDKYYAMDVGIGDADLSTVDFSKYIKDNRCFIGCSVAEVKDFVDRYFENAKHRSALTKWI